MLEKVCPLCNKLKNEIVVCERCNEVMYDKGRVQEYLDPYGAEEPIVDSDNYCYHLFSCPNCNNTQRRKIMKVII